MARKPHHQRTKTLTRQQRLRRRKGNVKRVELVLVADSTRDQYLADFLNELPRGATSEFVRQAIEEKIAREIVTEGERSNGELEALLNDIVARLDDLQHRQPPPAPDQRIHAPLVPLAEDCDELEIAQVTGGDSAHNFLASLNNLQL